MSTYRGYNFQKVSAGHYIMNANYPSGKTVAIDYHHGQKGWIAACSWGDMKTVPLPTLANAKLDAAALLDASNIRKIEA